MPTPPEANPDECRRLRGDHVAGVDRGLATVYRHAMAKAAGVARWTAFAALVLLVVAFVQSLRHPARLWSPGLMGRVLAWGVEPAEPPGGSASSASAGYPAP